MATTYEIPLGRSHQIDSSGNPLSGCLLYVYQTGTSTAVSIFSDSAGSSSAANPLVADSTGRLPLRYTTYAGALTLTLKTSAGVEVWSSNDVQPVVHAGGLAFAGDVSVEKASATFTLSSTSGAVIAILKRVAGALSYLSSRTANVERWRFYFATNDAEAGANAGSNAAIDAYDDAGTLIGRALSIVRSSLAATFGGALTATGAFTASSTSAFTGAATGASSIKSTSATAGIGYGTGAGGAVTQGTSRTTGVTLDKVCGEVTLFTAAGSATAASFTVTNSAMAATDSVILNQKSGADKYVLLVTAKAAGSFQITFYTTGGTTSEVVVISFEILKGVAA